MSLSERSPSEKVTHCAIPLTGPSGEGSTIQTARKGLRFSGGWVGGEEGRVGRGDIQGSQTVLCDVISCV